MLPSKCGLMVCHKLDSDSRALRSAVWVGGIKKLVVAGHGGSGDVTGPFVSLKRDASALGEIVAVIGAVTGELRVTGYET
jgi:carbonic anhydrase